MNKTLLVLRNEVITTLKRKSYLITAFALPLIAFLLFMVVSAVQSDSTGTTSESDGSAESQKLETEGYVDPGGLIQAIPEDIPAGTLRPYSDETQALAALDTGEITAYYIIPADYVEKGEIIHVHPEANPMSSNGQTWLIRWTLFVNLLDGDVERAARVWTPMEVQINTLSPEEQRDGDNPATFYVPYAITMVFYFVIMMGSSMLLQSVNEERKNRVIEILMQSITPRQLLSGKIIALGITGLLQTLIWFGTSYTLLRLGGRTFNLPPGLDMPPSLILWAVVFFLLGYAVQASLMAGLGALVPNLREASQTSVIVMLPMIAPLVFIGVLIESPHEALAIGLSIFPLTAPVAMMTRLSASNSVPLWQLLLAAGLLLGTAVVIVRAVARMFHAQILLSGQDFSLKRYFGALLGRV